jgi:hypothetical protein
MHNREFVFITFLIMLSLLGVAGCNGLLSSVTATPENAATETMTKTNTPEPTTTNTPMSTLTLTPTLAPTEVYLPGEFYVVDAGGFSFNLPESQDGDSVFFVEIEGAQANIDNLDFTVTASILSLDYANYDGLESSFETMKGVITGATFSDEPVQFEVAGCPGLHQFFQRDYNGLSIAGETVLVEMGNNKVLGIYANACGDDCVDIWLVQGEPFLDALLASIVFNEMASEESQGACPISTDPTYGYDPDNPVKVGGWIFEGPARERLFLDNLLGPQGEAISYYREGSIDHGDVILDVYHIEYADLVEPIILYIDMYNWEEPSAPVGFTCAGPFPLEEP